jgi:oligopeptide/dipeptide ABC transporter ATP-binding protein
MPENDEQSRKRLIPIEGSPPDLFKPPVGCGYFARCPNALKVCEDRIPSEFALKSSTSGAHMSRCWLHHEMAPASPVRSS